MPTDVPDIIEGDFLYSVIYRTGKREAFTGTYLTKRNLHTGELIWQTRYGYPEDPRQEVARLMYINSEGNIETINQVKRDKYLVNKCTFGYYNFIHSKRIFEKESGNSFSTPAILAEL